MWFRFNKRCRPPVPFSSPFRVHERKILSGNALLPGIDNIYACTAIQQCKNLYYTRPVITSVTIFIIFIYVASTLPWNSGHLASRGWSCRDAGQQQHGTNPGHPGKSGTGGNPTLWSHCDGRPNINYITTYTRIHWTLSRVRRYKNSSV